jgi:hypothetical protein
MLSAAASYMFSHTAQNEILLCDVHLYFYTGCAWCVRWQVTKIKPNVVMMVMGLKFFVVGKQTYDFCSEFFVHMY